MGSCMLWSPITFRIRVSHQAQEPPSESLPAELGMRQGASWRAYNGHRPHQSRQQRPPDLETQPIPDAAELTDLRTIRRRPVVVGVISEYRQAA